MNWDTPYGEAILTLARWHREGDETPTPIYAFPDPDQRKVRVIEVTQIVPQTGEVYPFEFAPTAEMPFRAAIAQVTPDEWTDISAGRIALPEGWDLAAMVSVPERVPA